MSSLQWKIQTLTTVTLDHGVSARSCYTTERSAAQMYPNFDRQVSFCNLNINIQLHKVISHGLIGTHCSHTQNFDHIQDTEGILVINQMAGVRLALIAYRFAHYSELPQALPDEPLSALYNRKLFPDTKVNDLIKRTNLQVCWSRVGHLRLGGCAWIWDQKKTFWKSIMAYRFLNKLFIETNTVKPHWI